MAGEDGDGGVRPIDFAPPHLGEEEALAVARVLRSGWLGVGPEVKAHEREVSELCQVDYAYGTGSATQALQVTLIAMLRAGVLHKDDFIAFPAITYTSMPMTAFMLGFRVLFVDVDDDCQMKASYSAVRASVVTHMSGGVCDLDRFKYTEGFLIEDAAHLYPGFKVGKYVAGDCRSALSDACIFSYYPTKCIASCEGGLVTTNHDWPIRSAISDGMDKDPHGRYKAGYVGGPYAIVGEGLKGNMNDVQACIAREQLKKAKTHWAKRQWLSNRYLSMFASTDVRVLQRKQRSLGQHSEHLMVVQLPSAEYRPKVQKALAEKGIATSMHFESLDRHPFWQSKIFDKRVRCYDELKTAHAYADTCLSLPIHPAMTTDDVERVVSAVVHAIG